MNPLDVAEVRGAAGVALAALARLVAWLRGMGPFAGVGLALFGAVLVTAADRLRRPVATLGGAAVGALAARAAGPVLPGVLSTTAWTWVLALVGAAAAGLMPLAFPALTGALVGAILGVHVPVAGRPALGAAIAAAVGAALLAVGGRTVATALACLGGGLALAVALVGLAGGRELGVELAARPMVLLGFAVVVGIAGAAFQLAPETGRARVPEPPRLPRE